MTGNFSLRRTLGIGAVALGTAAAALTVGAAPAWATGTHRYVATTGSDTVSGGGSNDCTVQAKPCLTIGHAVNEAAPNDTIDIGPGNYRESVYVDMSLTFVGAGSARTNVSGDHDSDPGFQVAPNEVATSVTLKDLSASHNPSGVGLVGYGSDITVVDSAFSDDAGGGIFVAFGRLDVSGSVVADNPVSPSGSTGPMIDGTGIGVSGATLTVDATTVRGNAGSGVAVFDQAPTLALAPAVRRVAAALPQSSAAITDSTVSGNQVGGVVDQGAAVTVAASTVAGNVAGGVVAVGTSAGVQISNSTISGTTQATGPAGPGPEQGGVIDLTAAVPGLSMAPAARRTLDTALSRWAERHPALLRQAAPRRSAAVTPAPTTGTTITGSIVAGQDGLPDCYGTVTDGGYNLSGDATNSCRFSAADHDLVRTDPRLGALADNGGPTWTELIRKGSPAIDVIPAAAAACSAAPQDQRGIARPQGSRCDIGAVEAVQPALTISPGTLPHGTVGHSYRQVLHAAGGLGAPYAFSLAKGTLPDGLTLGPDGTISGTPTKAGTFRFTVSVDDPVLKAYTIVVDAPAAPNGNGAQPIAATGAPVGSMTAAGAGAVFAGFLLLLATGLIGRRPGRHRARG